MRDIYLYEDCDVLKQLLLESGWRYYGQEKVLDIQTILVQFDGKRLRVKNRCLEEKGRYVYGFRKTD